MTTETEQVFERPLEEVLQEGIDAGVATQGKEFTFTLPQGRTPEEGLMLPELVFQALGAAVAEGMAARDSGEALDYRNIIDIGHNLLAHVADQVRAR